MPGKIFNINVSGFGCVLLLIGLIFLGFLAITFFFVFIGIVLAGFVIAFIVRLILRSLGLQKVQNHPPPADYPNRKMIEIPEYKVEDDDE